MTFLEATARLSGDIWATCNMSWQLCMQMAGVKNMPGNALGDLRAWVKVGLYQRVGYIFCLFVEKVSFQNKF